MMKMAKCLRVWKEKEEGVEERAEDSVVADHFD